MLSCMASLSEKVTASSAASEGFIPSDMGREGSPAGLRVGMLLLRIEKLLPQMR